MKYSFLFLLFFSIISGCYYDSEDVIYASNKCVTPGNVSFATDIKPILAASCVTCHYAGSNIGDGINLDGWAATQPYAKSGALLGSIKQVNYKPMPKGQPKLDDCKISKVEAWINAGYPNN
jgi:hypothetical protein